MVEGSRTSQRMFNCLCAANGSITAVAGSGISTMSDSLMPFHPEMDEPSNILPSSKVPSSIACAGKDTWCCTPRMSAKRRSTKATFSSLRVFRTLSAVDMAGGLAGGNMRPRQAQCHARLLCRSTVYEAAAARMYQSGANYRRVCTIMYQLSIPSLGVFRLFLADIRAKATTVPCEPLHAGDVVSTRAGLRVAIFPIIDERDHDFAAADLIPDHARIPAQIPVALHRPQLRSPIVRTRSSHEADTESDCHTTRAIAKGTHLEQSTAIAGERKSLGVEWPLPFCAVILIVGWLCKPALSVETVSNPTVGFAFVAFFIGALLAAVSATRHAEHLAVRFGEPYGTLMLTLSAILLEIATVVTVMLHNADNPTFGRDTMFSVVMIVLNGIIGVALLVGGLRHHEQSYNLRGANAFLSLLIPLATLALIWPNVTVTTGGGTFSPVQKIFLIVMSLLLYAAFMMIQTRTHTSFFVAEGESDEHAHHPPSRHGWPWHAALLIVYLVMVVLLAKLFALPL